MNRQVLAIMGWATFVISILAEVWVWAVIGYNEEIGTAWAVTTSVLFCMSCAASIWETDGRGK